MISSLVLYTLSSLNINSSFACFNKIENIDSINFKINLNFQQFPKQELVVLHSSFEGPNAKVGGLGAVVTDLITHQNNHKAQNKKTMQSYALTPYYQFIKEKSEINIIYQGQFSHYMFGKMAITNVYKNNHLNQFFLEPEEAIRNCMSVVKKVDDIYEQSHAYLRLIYWNSATSAFAALFAGVDQASTTNILHVHGWQSGLSASLLKKIYNPARRKVGLPSIKVVASTHIVNHEQGIVNAITLTDLGLQKAESDFINCAASMNIDADVSSTVSQGVGYEMLQPETGFGLHHIFQVKKNYKVFFPITNGIDYANFNPTLSSVLGNFRVCQTHLDLPGQKNRVKETLFNNGIISDPKRSLMLYVGRFSSEKGISLLDKISEEWTNLGGQMVIMGLLISDQTAKDAINRIIFKKNHHVKVYTNLHKDQLSPLSSLINVKKGNLIRFASDWTAVPSFAEACGLVPMEALSFGSGILTSHVQGLKDMCLDKYFNPIMNRSGDNETLNSITFKYNPYDMNETYNSLSENLKRAYSFQDNDKQGWKNHQIRWSLESRSFDWLEAIDKYYRVYTEVDAGIRTG